MITEQEKHEKRNRLAYLALHYAIRGNVKLSEKIRQLVKNIDNASCKSFKKC